MLPRNAADEPARRAMRAVLAWEQEHGRTSPDWAGRSKRILEAVAGDVPLRETDVRGLRHLLRSRRIPEDRIGLVKSILQMAGAWDAEDVGPLDLSQIEPDTWSHEQVRDWIERHGGNLSAAARRLGVSRTNLQTWKSDPAESSTARAVPDYIRAHMETIDRLAQYEPLLDEASNCGRLCFPGVPGTATAKAAPGS